MLKLNDAMKYLKCAIGVQCFIVCLIWPTTTTAGANWGKSSNPNTDPPGDVQKSPGNRTASGDLYSPIS